VPLLPPITHSFAFSLAAVSSLSNRLASAPPPSRNSSPTGKNNNNNKHWPPRLGVRSLPALVSLSLAAKLPQAASSPGQRLQSVSLESSRTGNERAKLESPVGAPTGGFWLVGGQRGAVKLAGMTFERRFVAEKEH